MYKLFYIKFVMQMKFHNVIAIYNVFNKIYMLFLEDHSTFNIIMFTFFYHIRS